MYLISIGSIYWGSSGGNNATGDSRSTPAIIKMDPITNTATVLLNNYFGRYFNTIDDLFVDDSGVIYFTDPGELEIAISL